MRGIGYDNEEARIIADHVLDAALCCYAYSGLAKILNITDSLKFRDPRRPMTVVRESPVRSSTTVVRKNARRPYLIDGNHYAFRMMA